MIVRWRYQITKFEIVQVVIQSVGVIAVTLTLYVYYRQLRTMDEQRKAGEREMAARMRPWMGLYGFGFEPADPPVQCGDILKILLRNCGALPAQRAHLSLLLHPSEQEKEDILIQWQEKGVKALVPGEDGNYQIDLERYPQFAIWREANRDVVVKGCMTYNLGQVSFRSDFEATLRFSENLDKNRQVKTRWRNTEIV